VLDIIKLKTGVIFMTRKQVEKYKVLENNPLLNSPPNLGERDFGNITSYIVFA
jgi:hypothetical protein